jgi:hypothetical protein
MVSGNPDECKRNYLDRSSENPDECQRNYLDRSSGNPDDICMIQKAKGQRIIQDQVTAGPWYMRR